MTRFAFNPWARNAGQVRFNPVPTAPRVPSLTITPTTPGLSTCPADFDAFYSANASEYATKALALAAFGAASPTCNAWAQAQIAALSGTPEGLPSTMTDAQCANAWDAWRVTNGARYPSTASALYAFASAYPACQAWATAQARAQVPTYWAPSAQNPSANQPVVYSIVQPTPTPPTSSASPLLLLGVAAAALLALGGGKKVL